jgi:hypothetical protein
MSMAAWTHLKYKRSAFQSFRDVVQAKDANVRPVQGLQLDAIRTHKWHIIRCSAITGVNLKEGLAWVVQDAKARLFLY